MCIYLTKCESLNTFDSYIAEKISIVYKNLNIKAKSAGCNILIIPNIMVNLCFTFPVKNTFHKYLLIFRMYLLRATSFGWNDSKILFIVAYEFDF